MKQFPIENVHFKALRLGMPWYVHNQPYRMGMKIWFEWIVTAMMAYQLMKTKK